jgi:hypothetical protein
METAKPDRSAYAVRKTTLREQDNDAGLEGTSVAERMDMMWQLALDAWAFMGEPVTEQRLPRHIVRVHRRGR